MERRYEVKSVMENISKQLFVIHPSEWDHVKPAGACLKQAEMVVLHSLTS